MFEPSFMRFGEDLKRGGLQIETQTSNGITEFMNFSSFLQDSCREED